MKSANDFGLRRLAEPFLNRPFRADPSSGVLNHYKCKYITEFYKDLLELR